MIAPTGVFPPKVWSKAGPAADCLGREAWPMDRRSVGTMSRVVSAARLHVELARTLAQLRRPDGGLPVSLAGESEVEPTTLAALALDDPHARAWLASRQRPDGGYDELRGRHDGPTTSALAALALEQPAAARRALAFAIAHRGLPLPNAADPDRRTAWGWTDDARSLIEPTARVLLAVNVLTPEDDATRREAVELLRTRQCADGGWNFGNASVYDVDLRGYAQTTAMGLIALQHGDRSVLARATAFLRRNWPLEPGGLTVAQALVAFRLHGVDDAVPPLQTALAAISRRPSFLERPLAVAWATLATGPDRLLEPLRSRA